MPQDTRVRLLSSLHVHLVNLEVSRRCVIWLASTAKVVMVWNGKGLYQLCEEISKQDNIILVLMRVGRAIMFE